MDGKCLSVLLLLATVAAVTSELTFSFQENTEAGYSIGRLNEGSDYEFIGQNESRALCNKYFILVFDTGEIQTKIVIDREEVILEIEQDTISCQIAYTSDGSTHEMHVSFHILDVNDYVPKFSGLKTQYDIYENVAVGGVIIYLMPVDLDAGSNGTVNFSITSGNEEGFFAIPSVSNDSPDRLLLVNKSLNYETHKMFNLTFFLHDYGHPQLGKHYHVIIIINDINDQSPSFAEEHLTFNVKEDHKNGSSFPIAIINATDEDSVTHSQIYYSINLATSIDSHVDEYFAVNATTGELYLISKLDYEETIRRTFRFVVEARNPESPAGTNVEITVNVIDVNDEIPSVISLSQSMIIEEGQSQTFRFIFIDQDYAELDRELNSSNVVITPPINYTSRVSKEFSYTSIEVTIAQSIDREIISSFIISITVTDSGTPPLSSTTSFTFSVVDINDNVPQFAEKNFAAKISDSSKPVKPILNVTAVDPDEGQNGSVYYTIYRVEPLAADGWFSIDNHTGLISLISQPDYKSTNGTIRLMINATDSGTIPLSNTTVVTITLSTSVTFQTLSYQQYNGFDLLSSTSIYMEFRTSENNGLLMYQEFPNSFVSLEITDSYVFYSVNGSKIQSNVKIASNSWYSVMLTNSHVQELLVFERDSSSNSQALQILQTSVLHDCSDKIQNYQLYVGGVEDVFTVPTNRLKSFDLIGCIGTIIINNKQIDISCPVQSRNTMNGCHYSSCQAITCSKESRCIPYSSNSIDLCQCRNGFQLEACNDTEDYDPITILSSSYAQFTFDYNFFYYKWKNSNYTTNFQNIKISFIPTSSNVSGVLFYSKTRVSIQRLEYDKTLRYQIFAINYKTKFSLISEEIYFKAGKEYEITLTLNKYNGQTSSLYMKEKDGHQRLLTVHINHDNEPLCFFAQSPSTLVNVGGTSDTMAKFVSSGNFSGCITSFSIDNMTVPIKGLMTSGAGNFTVRGSHDGILPNCKLCSLPNICPTSSTCIQSTNSQYTYMNVSVLPTPTRTQITGSIEEPTSDTVKLPYIITIAIAGVLVIAIILIVLVVAFRCAYKRGKKAQRPQINDIVNQNSENCFKENQNLQNKEVNGILLETIQSKKTNNYIHTSLTKKPYDIDRDSIITPCRKSTSQETGFQTASEQDNPSTRSSPRRISESGKDSEHDSDFNSFETDSEDLTTSGIEEAVSPSEMRLVSSGSMMGVPASFRRAHPLSPQEKKILTPLRPNSSMLLSDDETDTEISTTTNRNGHYSDNDSISSFNNQWYKSCSPVDGQPMVLYNAPVSKKNRKSSNKHLSYVKNYKSASPQHSPYDLNHTPHNLSTSPLIKSHRHNFEYPPAPPIGSGHNQMYYDTVEQGRLPAIVETIPLQYPMQPPTSYHNPYHAHPHNHTIGHSPPHLPYYMGYQGTNLTPAGVSTTYRDLNSLAKVNPITYWEQQQRLKPTVDQDDPLRFLTEPYRKFDDVSTTPSVAESTVIDDKESSIIIPAEIKRPPGACGIRNDYVMMPRTLPPSAAQFLDDASQETVENMAEEDTDEIVITHFPSADCTPTLPSLNEEDNIFNDNIDVYPASYSTLTTESAQDYRITSN